MLRYPNPLPTAQTVRVNLNEEQLKYGLSVVNKYLERERPLLKGSLINDRLPIIAIGGVVAVLYLRNRNATQDVDYICTNQTVRVALERAVTRASVELQGFVANWMNGSATHFVSGFPECESIAADSVAQNVVIYQNTAMTVYAADFRFQLASKINRAYKTQDTTHYEHHKHASSVSDAVAILREIMIKRNGQPIPLAELMEWYGNPGFISGAGHIAVVNNAFIEVYGRPAITL